MNKKVLVTGILLATLCFTGCGGPVDNIKDATRLTQEQSQQVLAELQSVGVTNFGNVNKADGQKDVYYIVDEKYGQTFFRIKNDKVSEIENSFSTVYKNGEKLDTIDDVYISNQQQGDYRVAAKEAVLSKLKAPSTAKFDIKQVIRYKNSVTVRGTVDAQNEFGAMIKSTFFVKILADTGAVDSISVNNL